MNQQNSAEEKPSKKRGGFWVVLTVTLLVLIFGNYYFENVAGPKRAYSSHAKSELREYFLACQKFWDVSGPQNSCSITTASSMGKSVGDFYHSEEIQLSGGGNKDSFRAEASHISLPENIFQINSQGEISKKIKQN